MRDEDKEEIFCASEGEACERCKESCPKSLLKITFTDPPE
jgi:hypothetical protein